jgi:oleate hydratase
VEFRRYLHRFIHEFPRINTLAGVDRTPLNQHDSIILPIETYLKSQGVEFRYGQSQLLYESGFAHRRREETKVTGLSFAEPSKIAVKEIHLNKNGATGIIHVEPADIVFATIGSMTASSSLGSNTMPPLPLPTTSSAVHAPDGSWELWESLTHTPHRAAFGNPSNFYSRPIESKWLSFTVTLHDSSFFSRLEAWSGNPPGTGALITFKDSNWLMSIVVPKQPHFLNQPEDVQVFWGYALFPFALGNIIAKPMASCTGEEILTELLGHLNFPQHPTVEAATTIPCMMPFITSQFLTRERKDRPKVIPNGSTNLALLGQFVEIKEDVVFTVEYSVKGAQMAVFGLMGVDKEPKSIYKGEHNVKVLAEALKMLLT